MRTVLDEVILWNRRKAKEATDPKDKARYEDNIENLKAYKKSQTSTAHKEQQNGR